MGVSTMVLIMVVAFFVLGRRRRHWERWQQGPPGLRRGRGGYAELPEGPQPERAAMDAYVETLESRIATLEERLDFTEKLLQGRTEKDARGEGRATPPTS